MCCSQTEELQELMAWRTGMHSDKIACCAGRNLVCGAGPALAKPPTQKEPGDPKIARLIPKERG